MTIRPWTIGLFLIIGFGLFTGILFLIGNRQKAFSRHLELYAEFANVAGLPNGAKVRVSGFDAGKIKKIEVPQNASGKFRLELQIEEKLHALIRKDSVVSIQTEGVVGDTFVSVKKGTDQAAEAPAGSTLPSKEPLDLAELLEKGSGLLNDVHGSVQDIRGRVDVALDSLTKTVNHSDDLILGVKPKITKIAATAGQITDQINTLTADLNAGKGPAGLLLRDEATRQQLQDTLSNVNRISANINQASVRANQTLADFQSRDLAAKAQATIENVQSVTQQLNVTLKDALAQDNMGEDGGANLRRTLSNLNRSTANLAEDTEALKHNFFFRGFFKKRGFYDLDQLTPAEYLATTDRQKTPGSRVWLTAADLFTKTDDGHQQLTEAGRHEIDAQVAPAVDTLPGQLIVIEGYAVNGSPDQQFVTARSRADLVRRYLEAHFHLRHSDVGIVALRDKPPKNAGRDNWNGAAIVLPEVKAK